MTFKSLQMNHQMDCIKRGDSMNWKQQLLLTIQLSLPAILAQLSSIVMQYIDASMVGHLGANESASIGLVSTTTWLFWGLCSAITMGFSVQVAHRIGANDNVGARRVLRQAFTANLLFSLLLLVIGVLICNPLPLWLGGGQEIASDATLYFLVFILSLPILQLNYLAGGMLRCSGNMHVPSLLNIAMCVLDVVFNFFLIFPSHTLFIRGLTITLPGAGLGVMGAALGTTLAECIICIFMVRYLCFRSPELRLNHEWGSFRPTRTCLRKAFRIGFPMGCEHLVMCTAQILITIIVAPLGALAIAAYSFAVTAESFCYMPGYGIADAATTLVGQSLGAKRSLLARRFAYTTIGFGMVIMTLMGIIMYTLAPLLIGLMTPHPEIQALGVSALRIEAFAEPMFAASIVGYGIFVGAGDTLLPSLMNFGSMWGVRLSLAAVLTPIYGFQGVWIAMCIELCFRGFIFLLRLWKGRWLRLDKIL